jgi:thiol-disulfide isomerase/thioredoxin
MRRAIPILLLSLAVPSEEVLARPPEAVQYVGRLEGKLVVESRQGAGMGLEPVPEAKLGELPAAPSPGDRVFEGKIWLRKASPSVARVVLVEPAAPAPGTAFVYVDLDQDGRLSAQERFKLAPEPDGQWESVTVRFPLKVGAFDGFPVYLGRPLPEKDPSAAFRRMAYSRPQVQGTVPVGSRKVRVRYQLDLDTGQVEQGYQAMDLDGNGTFDRGLSRAEVEMPDEQGVVIFHLGDLYLSTLSVDTATGRIVLRPHPASEYQRFNLAPGALVPDFAFTGMDGKPHRLSELRGKVVLLDFWGTWCGPCVVDMPKLRRVRETYRDRGFEIVGLDFDDDLETQRKFVAEKDLPWIHATSSSVADLVRSRFRVAVFPTKILLDREGRVVSVGDPGQPPLREEDDVRKAVEEVLSRPVRPSQAGVATSSR